MNIDYTLSDSDLLMNVADMRSAIAFYNRSNHYSFDFRFYRTVIGTYRLYLSVYNVDDPHVIHLALSRGGVREFKTFESLLSVFRSICDGADYGLSFVS